MADLRLHGILAATVTPFHEDGSVDLEALGPYVDWLVDQGVHAVVMHADSGEGHALAGDERTAVVRRTAEVVDGRIPIVAGLIAQSTDEAVRLGRADRDAGADALMVFPPTSFLGSPLPAEVPAAHHRAITSGTGLPLVAFQLQGALGGVEYATDALEAILAIDGVVAIKESTFDARKFRATMRLVRTVAPDVAYLSGNDNFIYESFVLGADGCLIGNGTVTCREQVAMYESVAAGDLERGAELARRIERLVDLTYAPPIRNYRARLKHILVQQGVLPSDRVRAPLPPLPPDEAAALRVALDELATHQEVSA